MKRNPEFILSRVAGKSVLIPTGKTSGKYNNLIKLNETGELIWNYLSEDRSLEDIAGMMEKEYEVSHEEALADAAEFVGVLKNGGGLADE